LSGLLRRNATSIGISIWVKMRGTGPILVSILDGMTLLEVIADKAAYLE